MFHYRRRLPGRARGEFAVSLHTRRFREAEHLAGMLDGAFPDAWNRAVSEAKDGGDLNASLRRLMNAMVTADLARRFEAASRGEPMFPADDVAFFRRARAWARQNINTSAAPETVAGPVERMAQRHPEEESWSLRIAVWEAFIQAMEKMEAFALGQRPIMFDEPEPPRAAAAVMAVAPIPPPPAPAKPLAAALLLPPADAPEKPSPYFAWRATQKDATEQVMGQERGVFRRFLEHCGDRPVDAYRRADITRFLDIYRRLPRYHGKSPRDKRRSLTEIIAEADRKGAVRLKEKTVEARMSALSQFFKRCWNLGYITKPDLDELVAGHEFRIDTAARDQRDAWRSEELVKLLGSPVWGEATPPSGHGPVPTSSGIGGSGSPCWPCSTAPAWRSSLTSAAGTWGATRGRGSSTSGRGRTGASASATRTAARRKGGGSRTRPQRGWCRCTPSWCPSASSNMSLPARQTQVAQHFGLPPVVEVDVVLALEARRTWRAARRPRLVDGFVNLQLMNRSANMPRPHR